MGLLYPLSIVDHMIICVVSLLARQFYRSFLIKHITPYLRLSFLWDVLHLFQRNIGPYKMSAINILHMFFLTFIFLTKETKSAKPTINILHMFSFILYCSFLQHITPYVSSVPGLGMSYIQANYIYPSYLPISKLPPYIQAIYIYPSYLPISKLPTYIQATYL